MQLYALDQGENVVFVEDAHRGHNYLCPECRSPLRVRGGTIKRDHFFHLTGSGCSQSAKSLEHLQMQCRLKEILPGEVALERRFPSINRIADVVWEPERIIFEVQCSPISAAEVESRNRDYASQGYQVVWLLHEKSFNKRRETAAEHYLRGSPHYYIDMNADGLGGVYDRSRKSPVAFKLGTGRLSGIRAKWPCHLEGTVDLPQVKRNPKRVKRFFVGLYRMFLESFLE